MADLRIPLKGVFFDQIKAGTKVEEFRICKPYWAKRLEGRSYDRLVLPKGYPKRCDIERTLVLPYRGYVKKTHTHEHFGAEPVEVYAIKCDAGEAA